MKNVCETEEGTTGQVWRGLHDGGQLGLRRCETEEEENHSRQREQSAGHNRGLGKAQHSLGPAKSPACWSPQLSTEVLEDQSRSLTVDATLRQFGLTSEACSHTGVSEAREG